MTLKKNLIAFVIISILGTIGHFLYEWTGENQIIGFFSPVNESTWEHLKLLFFPTVIYSVFEYFIIKEKPQNYISAVVISVIRGMLAIVVLFYTQKGILGYSIDFINILIYYISVFYMIIMKQKIINRQKYSNKISQWVWAIIGFIIALLFIFFTNNPPSLGIFIPPIN